MSLQTSTFMKIEMKRMMTKIKVCISVQVADFVAPCLLVLIGVTIDLVRSCSAHQVSKLIFQ